MKSCPITPQRKVNITNIINKILFKNRKGIEADTYRAENLYKDFYDCCFYAFKDETDNVIRMANIVRLMAAVRSSVEILSQKSNIAKDFFEKNTTFFDKKQLGITCGYRDIAVYVRDNFTNIKQNEEIYKIADAMTQDEALEKWLHQTKEVLNNKRKRITKKFENIKSGDKVVYITRENGKIKIHHGSLKEFVEGSNKAIITTNAEDVIVPFGNIQGVIDENSLPSMVDYISDWLKVQRYDNRNTDPESYVEDQAGVLGDGSNLHAGELEVNDFIYNFVKNIKQFAEENPDLRVDLNPNDYPLLKPIIEQGKHTPIEDFFKRMHADTESTKGDLYAELVELTGGTFDIFYKVKKAEDLSIRIKREKEINRSRKNMENIKRFEQFNFLIDVFKMFVKNHEKTQRLDSEYIDELPLDDILIEIASDFDNLIMYDTIVKDMITEKKNAYVHSPGEFVTQVAELAEDVTPAVAQHHKFISNAMRDLSSNIKDYSVRIYSSRGVGFNIMQNGSISFDSTSSGIDYRGNNPKYNSLSQEEEIYYQEAVKWYGTKLRNGKIEYSLPSAFALICDKDGNPINLDFGTKKIPFIIEMHSNSLIWNESKPLYEDFMRLYMSQYRVSKEKAKELMIKNLALRDCFYWKNKINGKRYEMFTIKEVVDGHMFYAGDWSREAKLSDLDGSYKLGWYVNKNRHAGEYTPNGGKYPHATGLEVVGANKDRYHVNLCPINRINIQNGIVQETEKGKGNVVDAIIRSIVNIDTNLEFNGTNFTGENKLSLLSEKILPTFLFINCDKTNHVMPDLLRGKYEKRYEQSYLQFRKVDDQNKEKKFVLRLRTQTNEEYESYVLVGKTWRKCDITVGSDGLYTISNINNRTSNSDLQLSLENLFTIQRTESNIEREDTYELMKVNSIFESLKNNSDSFIPYITPLGIKVLQVKYNDLVIKTSRVLVNADNIENGKIVRRNPYVLMEPNSTPVVTSRQIENIEGRIQRVENKEEVNPEDGLPITANIRLRNLYKEEKEKLAQRLENLQKGEIDDSDFIAIDADPLGPSKSDLPFSIGHDDEVSEEDIKAAQEWYDKSPIKGKLGDVKQLLDMVNKNGVARFTRSSIELLKGSDYTDVYHEAWHAYSWMYLNKEDRKKIVDEVRNSAGKFKNHKGKTIKFSEASFDDIDEYLADNFRLYAKNGGKFTKEQEKNLGKETKNFFQRFLDFLRSLFSNATKDTKESELYDNPFKSSFIRELFDNLYKGNINDTNFGKDAYSNEEGVAYTIRNLSGDNAVSISKDDTYVWVHPGIGLAEYMYSNEGAGSTMKKIPNITDKIRDSKQRVIVDFSVEYGSIEDNIERKKAFKEFKQAHDKAVAYAKRYNKPLPLFVMNDHRAVNDDYNKIIGLDKSVFVGKMVALGVSFDDATDYKKEIDKSLTSANVQTTTSSFADMIEKGRLEDLSKEELPEGQKRYIDRINSPFSQGESSAAIRLLDSICVKFINRNKDNFKDRNLADKNKEITEHLVSIQNVKKGKPIKPHLLLRTIINNNPKAEGVSDSEYISSLAKIFVEEFNNRTNTYKKDKIKSVDYVIPFITHTLENKSAVAVDTREMMALLKRNDPALMTSMYTFAKKELQDEIESIKSRAKNGLTKTDSMRYVLLNKMLLNFGSPFDRDFLRGEGVIFSHLTSSPLLRQDIDNLTNDEQMDEKKVFGEDYSMEDNEKSMKDMMKDDIKFLISTLPKLEKGVEQTDIYGTPLFESPTKVLNILGRELLADVNSKKDRTFSMFDKEFTLNNRFTKMLYNLNRISQIHPFAKELIRRLGDPTKEDFDSQALWTRFYQSFDKARVEAVYVRYVQDGETYDVRVGVPMKQLQVEINQWQQDFSPLKGNYYCKENSDGRIVYDYENLGDYYVENFNAGKMFFLNGSGDSAVVTMRSKGYRKLRKENGKTYDDGLVDINAARDIISFLNAVGINLPNNTRTQQEVYEHWLDDTINGLSYYRAVLNIAQSVFKTESSSKSLDALIRNERKSVEVFANLSSKFSDKGNQFQYVRADQKFGYENMLHNELTIIVDALNDCNTYQDLLDRPEISWMDIRKIVDGKFNESYNARIEATGLIQRLFDFDETKNPKDMKRRTTRTVINNETQTGRSVKAELRLISGSVKDDSVGQARYGTNEVDHFIESIMLSRFGIYEIARAAESPTCFTFRLNDGFSGNIVGFKDADIIGWLNTNNTKSFDQEKITKMFSPAIDFIKKRIRGEAERMLMCKMKSYDETAEQDWDFIEKGMKWDVCLGVIPQEVLNKILSKEELDKLSVEDIKMIIVNSPDAKINLNQRIASNEENIYKALNDYYFDLYTTAQARWDSYTQESKDKNGKIQKIEPFDLKLKEPISPIDIARMTVNNSLNSMFTWDIFCGDLAQIKLDDANKRNKGANGTGEVFRTDDNISDYINGVLNKSSFLEQAKKRNDINEKYKEQIQGAPGFKYGPVLDTATLKELKYKSIYEYAKDFDAYQSMDVCDGQGFITFDAYRALKFSQGMWSTQQEELFQKICRGENISVKDAHMFFPVMKAQYYGPNANEGVIDENKFHKYSLMPIIPSICEGTPLEALHYKMMKEGLTYVTFKSGKKTGIVARKGEKNGKLVNKLDEMFIDEPNPKRIKDDFWSTPFVKDRIFTHYLKDQVYVHEEDKGKILYPTQLRRVLYIPFFSNGVPKDYKESKESWDNLNEEEKLNTSPIYRKVRAYEKATEAYVDIERKKFFKEYDIKLIDGKYTVGNLDALSDIIQRELRKNDIIEDNLKFIFERLKEGRHDLSASYSVEDIEEMIMSLINRKLIKISVKGDAYVQVANALFQTLKENEEESFTNPTEKDLQKYGTDDLPFYRKEEGVTKPMKIKLALRGGFKKLLDVEVAVEDGGPLKVMDGENVDYKASIKKLNTLLKNEKLIDKYGLRKYITLVGVRIPTQGPNSTECMEVYEFLASEAGNIIIPPAEIVAKTGSDFDIDKMYIMKPEILVSNGKIKDISRKKADGSFISDEEIDDEISQLKIQEEDILAELGNEIKQEEGESLIESAKDWMESSGKEIVELAKENTESFNEAHKILEEEYERVKNESSSKFKQWVKENPFNKKAFLEFTKNSSDPRIKHLRSKIEELESLYEENNKLNEQFAESQSNIEMYRLLTNSIPKRKNYKPTKEQKNNLKELEISIVKQREIIAKQQDISKKIKEAKESVYSKANKEIFKETSKKYHQENGKRIFDELLKTMNIPSDKYDAISKNKSRKIELLEKQSRVKNLLERYYTIKSEIRLQNALLKTTSIGNDLLFSMEDLILDDAYFSSLITPNSTDKFKAKKGEEDSLLDQFKNMNGGIKSKDWMTKAVVSNILHDEGKYLSNFIGKESLGILAVDNVSFSSMLRHGLDLNRKFSLEDINKKQLKNIQDILKELQNYGMKISFGNDGKGNFEYTIHFSYSKINDEDIQDYISQLINGAVDVAKDDWIFFLGLTKQNIGLFTMMIMSGIEPKTALDLINTRVNKVMKIQRSTLLSTKTIKNDDSDPLVNFMADISSRLTELKITMKTDTERDINVKDIVDKKIKEQRLLEETPFVQAPVLLNESILSNFNQRQLKLDILQTMYPMSEYFVEAETYPNQMLKEEAQTVVDEHYLNGLKDMAIQHDQFIQHEESLADIIDTSKEEEFFQRVIIYEETADGLNLERKCHFKSNGIDFEFTDVPLLIDKKFSNVKNNERVKNLFFKQWSKEKSEFLKNEEIAKNSKLYKQIIMNFISDNKSLPSYIIDYFKKGKADFSNLDSAAKVNAEKIISTINDMARQEYTIRKALNKMPYGGLNRMGKLSYASQWDLIKSYFDGNAEFEISPLAHLDTKLRGNERFFIYNDEDEFTNDDLRSNIIQMTNPEFVFNMIQSSSLYFDKNASDYKYVLTNYNEIMKDEGKIAKTISLEVADYFSDMLRNMYYQSPLSSIKGKFNFNALFLDSETAIHLDKFKTYFKGYDVSMMQFVADQIKNKSYNFVNFDYSIDSENESINRQSRHINSGGAEGSDNYFRVCLDKSEFSGEGNYHYYIKNRNINCCPFGNVVLPGDVIEKAFKTINKSLLFAETDETKPTFTIKDERILRNFAQVEYSNSVVAVGFIINTGDKISTKQNETRVALEPCVSGGTFYAVRMAQLSNKNIFVFNQNDNKWYRYDYGKKEFKECAAPKYRNMSGGVAGIGTRQLSEEGKKAIREFFDIKDSKSVDEEYDKQPNTTINDSVEYLRKLTNSDVTKSQNVEIVPELATKTKETVMSLANQGIIAYRTRGKGISSMITALQEDTAVGNPFDFRIIGEGKAAVEFYNWLEKGGLPIGNRRINFTSKEQIERYFSRNKTMYVAGKKYSSYTELSRDYPGVEELENYRSSILNKFKNENSPLKIFYYKEKGIPSHATVLDKFINGGVINKLVKREDEFNDIENYGTEETEEVVNLEVKSPVENNDENKKENKLGEPAKQLSLFFPDDASEKMKNCNY